MSCKVECIKRGMVRIGSGDASENYLERYGLVTIPEKEAFDGVVTEDNRITLPDGQVIEYELRKDNEVWDEEEDYLLKKFRDVIPISRIDGRPDEILQPSYDVLEGRGSDKKFGISFNIGDDDKFYGLGEAKRDGIQLRSGSYQNWTVYQHNEIAIPLVYSNKNWGIFINAYGRHFVDIDDHIKGKLTILGNFDSLDVFLLYGSSMKDILGLYTELTGKSMLLPKWAYGLNYIAPLHQNQFELLDDMMKFREKHIPCDNVSLEPGWMEKFYDYSFDKKWDRKKFHIDPWMRPAKECQYSFPSVLHRFNFHMALWLCMDYDLCDQEEREITGKGEIPAWYDHVKQFTDDGADGFKLDPADMVMRIDPNKVYSNKKSEFEMHNVSQVLVMKQMYKGFIEQTGKRPYIHYSGGYAGQQHWGAATTGDNGGLLGSMIWLQNLAMSGFMNSTVDMDIYRTEGIHFAMFAPWAHHNAWCGCGQPWYAGKEAEEVYIYYARLRYRLIPYIYSSAIECRETGIPMIRPMPLEFQNDEKCLELNKQYMLGEFILISAFTDTVYLPEGQWYDFWTGDEYCGPYTIENYVPPKGRGGAFFIKKGAIIPQWKDRDYVAQYSDEEIELHIYPCGKSQYVFREDDGESVDYLQNTSCHTLITCEETADKINITIGKRAGDYSSKTKNKVWIINVIGTDKKINVICEEITAKAVVKNII